MAWKNIPGRTGWLFKDDAPVPTFTYLGAGTSVANAAKTTGGVRTDRGVQTYILTRQVTDAETVNRGEIDATSTLANVGVTGPQPASYFSSLPVSGAPPFGGQAYSYAINRVTDPTSASWTTKPAGYTYYPGEGIGADAPITNMQSMFNGASTFNEDISSWDVSTVTNMSLMFEDALAFNQDISSWNVGSVTDMTRMFYGANAFNNGGVALSGNFASTMTSVEYMNNMFNNALAFNQDISSWVVGSVTNMGAMFTGATVFNQPIGSWTVSSVTNMSFMFKGADAFNQPLNSWNVGSVVYMNNMFQDNGGFNQDLSFWNTSNVQYMNNMFRNAGAFNQDISGWPVTSVSIGAGFSNAAVQKGTLAANWQEAEHPSNVGLGNFYNL